MNYIHVSDLETKRYEVQVAYANFDSHGDKHGYLDEPDVWKVNIAATSPIEAVNNAMNIVTIQRAETMCNLHENNPMYGNKESYTHEELTRLYENNLERNVYSSWLLIKPTSIQVTLVDDVEKLRDMTIANLDNIVKSVSDEAEKFLKDNDE